MKDFFVMLRRHLVPTAIGAAGLLAFSLLVIRSFSDWNFPSEGVALDYINYFWGENFRFFKLPHFEWHSDSFLYPYGCDVTFIFWSFEMNIFGALFNKLFGDGPWGQCYYLLSLAITYFGIYALLAKRKGRAIATLFAFALTFCNYASICKFPGHFTHCIVHWPIISIFFDVVTIDKFWNGERFSARFVLSRALVLLLCFGCELGYVAGFACFSFFLTCAYLFCAAVIKGRSLLSAIKSFVREAGEFARSMIKSKTCIVLLALLLLVAWVYLPVIMQIVLNTPPQSSVPLWRTNPLRVFLPIIPGLNPATTYKTAGIMGQDVVDTIYAWSAGWSALLVLWIGVAAGTRENSKKWILFLIMIYLVMFMPWVPVAKCFPAFKCVRIPERFSLFLLPCMMIPFYYSSKQILCWLISNRKMAFVFLVPAFALWVLEITTAYKNTFIWVDAWPLTDFPADYKAAERTVKDLPGEALFFMPFSAHGGDGGGLTDFHHLSSHQMQFAARCGKKMNGVYLGRMPEELYLRDFSSMCWRGYFGPDVWSKTQWDNLETFFRNSDFCAAVVATSIFSPAQREDIVAHLGAPVAKFSLVNDMYEVFPVPDRLRGKKNLSAICEIFNYGSIETSPRFFYERGFPVQLLAGFGMIEPWGVWTVAKSCEMRFVVPRSDSPVRVVFNATAFVTVKTAEAYCGERKLADWVVSVPPMTPADYAVELPPELTGKAVDLRIELHDAARPRDLGMGNDARMLGMGFVSIRREEGDK